MNARDRRWNCAARATPGASVRRGLYLRAMLGISMDKCSAFGVTLQVAQGGGMRYEAKRFGVGPATLDV